MGLIHRMMWYFFVTTYCITFVNTSPSIITIFLEYNPWVLLFSDALDLRVQFEGGFNSRAGTITVKLHINARSPDLFDLI